MDKGELKIFLEFFLKNKIKTMKITYLEKVMDGRTLKVLH